MQVAFQIMIGNAVQAPASPATLWKFTNDARWTLTVEPGAVALFAGPDGYRGYEDFAATFSRVLVALSDTGRIARCDRLGIQFINIAEPIPGQERAWRRWFKPELLGLTGIGVFGEHTVIASSLTQSQLSARPVGVLGEAPVDVQALIRHGVLPANAGIPLESGTMRELEQESYVLDIDLFIQAMQRFDQATLLRQFEALHAQIDAFFHWSLTDEGRQDFGLVEL